MAKGITSRLTAGSLFAGIGAFETAAIECGIDTKWSCEVEPYCRLVLTARFPDAKQYGDICKLDGGKIEPVDIITFGSPCQDLSVAGRRAGLEGGKRSNLFYEAVRVIKEMRCATDGRYPTYAVWENVPGAYSSNKGQDFRNVLEALLQVKDKPLSIPMPESGRWARAGEVVGNGISLAWRTLDAQLWGVPQRRVRCFLVVDFAGESAGKILFDESRLRGDSAPGKDARQEPAGHSAGGSGAASAGFNGWKSATGSIQFAEERSPTIEATMPPNVVFDARGNGSGGIAPTITGDHNGHISDYTAIVAQQKAFDARGMNVPLVMDERQYALTVSDKVANTLTSTDYKGTQCVFEAKTFDVRQTSDGTVNTRNHAYETEISRSLDTGKGIPGTNHGGIAIVENYQHSGYRETDAAGTLRQSGGSNGGGSENMVIESRYAVRRLTPTECLRLQGLPDSHLSDIHIAEPTEADIDYWCAAWEENRGALGKSTKPRSRNQVAKWLRNPYSDSAAYRAIGNSLAVPCAAFVLGGITYAQKGNKAMKLHIDIETRSSTDIKFGVYKYASDKNFKVLLFAYRFGNGEVQLIDLTQEELPKDIKEALADPGIIKVAFNAQFERVCLSKHLGVMLDPAQWRCTMVAASYAGITGNLKHVAAFLGVEEQKDSVGIRLINTFSNPPFTEPEELPDYWQKFGDYCKQDVRTEGAVDEALSAWPVPEQEWEYYALDQRINDRGVPVDEALAGMAYSMTIAEQAHSSKQMKELTGVSNPASLAQLKKWVTGQGYQMESLGAEAVKFALADDGCPEAVKEVLRLRQISSGSAVKKYATMLNTSRMGRISGTLQFYGSARAGRWAGRLLQVQNLPRNNEKTIGLARAMAKEGDTEGLRIVYGSVTDILKQLIRTAIVPSTPEGKLYASDYSAIEARVIAWLAGEKWVLDVFRGDGKIYEEAAGRMLGKDPAEINSEERQKGKVATLALGYQGGVGALTAMGAIDMGIPEGDLQGIVNAWRRANPHIVRLWHKMEDAARAVISREQSRVKISCVEFSMRGGAMVITLPSRRELIYQRAQIDTTDRANITYYGRSTAAAMVKLETYGGKLAENVVQAIARDLLAGALMRIEEAYKGVIFHVHDEVVIDSPHDKDTEEITKLMTEVPSWADGLPLDAETKAMEYYQK